MRLLTVVCLAAVLVVSSAYSPSAQQVEGKWGVGGFVSYANPLFTFGERFSGGLNKLGLTASYVSSSRMTLEVEYHHAKMEDGALETTPFTWSPKAGVANEYTSKDLNPDARYVTKFNSMLLSGQVHFNAGRTMDEGSFSPYLIVGGGFYNHETVAEGIVWPGQSPNDAASAGGGLDSDGNQLPVVVMPRQTDTRTAVTVAFGVGVEAFLTPTIAVDLRTRYHFILGELRPYSAWELEKVFPLQMFDLSAGLKFYFWE